MYHKNIYKILFAFVILSIVLLPPKKVAALSFKLDGPKEPVLINQTFSVSLMLDAEGQSFNAVGGRIIWPADFEIMAISDANSIVSLWTERAHYDGQELIFSGIMPGGYSGSYSPQATGTLPGNIITIIARAKKVGNQTIRFNELETYLNDGSGKAIIAPRPELIVGAYGDTAAAPGKLPLIANDLIAPQDLTASIEKNDDVAEGKWFAVFSARDQESGIKSFYIQESKESSPNENWLPVGSPFVLTDQSRKSYVFIKAVDLNDNQSMVVIAPQIIDESVNKVAWGMNKFYIFAILAVMVMAIIVIIVIKKTRR